MDSKSFPIDFRVKKGGFIDKIDKLSNKMKIILLYLHGEAGCDKMVFRRISEKQKRINTKEVDSL